jgi:teichuronic acid biosynthesis glycosyltransferase TuaC
LADENMNILILSKRQYMGKDLLNDRYGRFYEIPRILAQRGHEVTGLCLSYRKRDERLQSNYVREPSVPAWFSINLGRLLVPGLARYRRELDKIIESTKPDVIYACSDSIHAILGRYAANRHGVKLVIDLYDNFDSYGATKMPGIGRTFVSALKDADGISVVSDRLQRYIISRYDLTQAITVLGNAVSKDLFVPLEKSACRKRLNLPENTLLVGTAGALHKNRDVQTLFTAFRNLRNSKNEVHLVLAGPRDRNIKLPTGNDVHDLGVLKHSDVATMYGALDLGVICNTDSAFGRYCYPQKFFEILACKLPVIAASVGTLQDILVAHPYALYEAGNPASLTAGMAQLLEEPQIPDLKIPDWSDRAVQLETFFDEITRAILVEQPSLPK